MKFGKIAENVEMKEFAEKHEIWGNCREILKMKEFAEKHEN